VSRFYCGLRCREERAEEPQPHKCYTANCCIASAEMHLIQLLCFMLLVPAKEVVMLKERGRAEPALESCFLAPA